MGNLLLSIVCITLGICLILYYNGLKKNEKGGLSINLFASGVIFIIAGLGLILREIF
jgi:energy-converting hydrogenase Eha subunit C